MLRKFAFHRFSLLVLLLAAGVSFISAQPKNGPPLDPAQKPQKVKKEPSAYGKWLSEDVPYIATKEEKEAFLKLQTDEERENFIANFWARRDPNPDTEENEFKEEYFERIAYANEHYTSGIPGWKTDRGRIYIAWGKPDGVESHPSGGTYDNPGSGGRSSMMTYPFEVWFYRHLEGIGSGIEIEFVDPTGTGEYKLARDPKEKDALAMGAGRSLNPNEQAFLRHQDLPFNKISLIHDLSKAPAIRFTDLQALVSTESGVILTENPIDFDLRVDFFRQSDDRVIAAFTVQAENKELTFKDNGGIQTANMNIFGRVTAVSGKRSGIFEDSVSTYATAQELVEARDRKSVYQKAIALQPGTYKVDVVIRDVASGKTGVVKKGFTVPKYDAEKLSTSTMVLATRLYQTTEKDIGGSFIIGDKKVIPNIAGRFRKGEEVGIYLQVYNSGIDQTTLRPSVDVEYILTKDGKTILKQPENWEGLSDSGQRLTLARLLPTEQLAPGNYEIKIKIHDRVTNQLLEPSEKFTVLQ